MVNKVTFKQLIDLQANVSEFYTARYPQDIYACNNINKNITFLDIFICILKPKSSTYTDYVKSNDLYTLIGVSNRDIINNIYDRLAVILDTYYEDIADIECNDKNYS